MQRCLTTYGNHPFVERQSMSVNDSPATVAPRHFVYATPTPTRVSATLRWGRQSGHRRVAAPETKSQRGGHCSFPDTLSAKTCRSGAAFYPSLRYINCTILCSDFSTHCVSRLLSAFSCPTLSYQPSFTPTHSLSVAMFSSFKTLALVAAATFLPAIVLAAPTSPASGVTSHAGSALLLQGCSCSSASQIIADLTVKVSTSLTELRTSSFTPNAPAFICSLLTPLSCQTA